MGLKEETKLVLTTFFLMASLTVGFRLHPLLAIFLGTLTILAYSLARGLPEESGYRLCLLYLLLFFALLAAMMLYTIIVARGPSLLVALGLDYVLLFIVAFLLVKLLTWLAYVLVQRMR